MYIRRVPQRPAQQTTPFLFAMTIDGNYTFPIIIKTPPPRYMTASGTPESFAFVTILSALCGLTTIFSLITVCVWCRKRNSVFPMNKSELPSYASRTSLADGDDISQTTEIVDNIDSCLSHLRKGVPKQPVTFSLSNQSSSSYYRSLEIEQRPTGNYILGIYRDIEGSTDSTEVTSLETNLSDISSQSPLKDASDVERV